MTPELDLDFTVTDDYGATGYALELRPEDENDGAWQTLEIDTNAVVPSGETDAMSTLLETARHPLAGSRVEIRLVATDAAGRAAARRLRRGLRAPGPLHVPRGPGGVGGAGDPAPPHHAHIHYRGALRVRFSGDFQAILQYFPRRFSEAFGEFLFVLG